MDILMLKKSVIEAAHRAYNRAYQTGTGGNFSSRIPGKDLMIVKPSGISFGDCTESNLIITDFNGKLVEGEGKPTKEIVLHGELYKKFPKIAAIMHCHSPWAVGWANTKEELPLITLHSKMKFKVPIATIDIETPVVSLNDMPRIFKILDERPNMPAFLLVAHGQVAFADSIINAEHIMELVEETAQVSWLTRIDTCLKNK